LSLRGDFNDLPLTNKYFLRFNPQVYYLRIADKDGVYAAGSLAIARRNFPFSLSVMVNKVVKSSIEVSEFEWNVGLTYGFGQKFEAR
jgi:hypothetical protein